MIIIKEILDRKEIIKDGKEVVMFYISYDGRSGLNHANIFIPIEFSNSVKEKDIFPFYNSFRISF